MCGTDIVYVLGGPQSERARKSCRTLSAYARAMRCPRVPGSKVVEMTQWLRGEPIQVSALRACYMSGTDLACGAISLRARYAMSGTDTAYTPTAFQY
eukprot:1395302-Rhodomonas_salina.2